MGSSTIPEYAGKRLPPASLHLVLKYDDISSFRPETLTCRPNQNTSTCLTGPQIFALHHIYSDYYEANQTYVFGSYYPGGETAFFNGLTGSDPFPIPAQYFGFFVLKWVDVVE